MGVTDEQIISLIHQFSSEHEMNYGLAGPKLEFIGEPALPFVLEASRDPRPQIRAGTLTTLRAFAESDLRAADALSAALDDPDDAVRGAAVRAAAATGSPRALEVILELIRRGKGDTVRYLLGCFDDPRAAAELSRMLSGDDPYNVLCTINALLKSPHRSQDRSTVDLASLVLEQVARRTELRRARAESRALRDKDHEKRPDQECAFAPDDHDDDDDDEDDGEIYRFAQELLCSVGESAIPSCITSLRSPLANVRHMALGVLETLPDPSFAAALVPLLDDPDPFIRLRAATMLGDLDFMDAVPILISTLDGSDVLNSRFAIHTLARIGDSRAILPICAALERFAANYDDYMLRQAAYHLTRFGTAGIKALIGLLKSADSATRWGVHWA